MRFPELHSLLSLAYVTASEAVKHIIEGEADARKVTSDLRRDVKVEADRNIEKFIVKNLLEESEFPILSEESGTIQGKANDDEYRWIVDPLDGSLNFSRGIPLCCISIGLWKGTEPVLGVVYDFNRNEVFTGIVDSGAWLNGAAVRVSDVGERAKAVLCTGFPVSTAFSKDALLGFVENVREFKKVRLFGSAALSLSYVACGRADYYQENDIKIWDVAAGLALVKAAGGTLRCSELRSDNTLSVEAATPRLLL